jgi:hypothetical protein
MPFTDLDAFRNHTDYKKILKQELGKVAGAPVKFHVFEKFKFANKTAPLMIVGKYDPKLIDEIKDTGAVFKAKGRCAKNGDAIEFAADQGTMPEPSLKTAMTDGESTGKTVKELTIGSAGKDEVLAEKQASGEVVTGAGGRGKDADEDKAARRLKEITQRFESVKGLLPDKMRADLRGEFEKANAAINGKRHAEALATLEKIEKDIQKESAAQQKSIEKTGADAHKLATDLPGIIKKFKEDIDAADKRLAALDKEWKDNKNQRDGEKYDKYQTRLANLIKRVEEEKNKFAEKKATLAAQLKSTEASKQAELKDLLTKFLGLAKRAEDLAKAAQNPPVGKLADNPALSASAKAIEGDVKKMAEASQWLKEEHNRVAAGDDAHGSGRHGAQTGLDRGAARAGTKNAFRPDSPQNPDGVTRDTRSWNKVELEWETLPNGKKKLINKKLIPQTMLAEVYPGQNEVGTTSMFLNPVLEKEAVDTALEKAKQCVWKYKANNQPLLELGIAVRPKSAPGWGYSISKIQGVQKKSVAQAEAWLAEFEDGKYGIDDLLKKLDVQIKTDRTGAGALMVPYAKVVLVRSSPNDPWKSKTHYPDDRLNATGWEIEGQGLRKAVNAPVENAPAMA